jgi:hypothetical protein
MSHHILQAPKSWLVAVILRLALCCERRGALERRSGDARGARGGARQVHSRERSLCAHCTSSSIRIFSPNTIFIELMNQVKRRGRPSVACPTDLRVLEHLMSSDPHLRFSSRSPSSPSPWPRRRPALRIEGEQVIHKRRACAPNFRLAIASVERKRRSTDPIHPTITRRDANGSCLQARRVCT